MTLSTSLSIALGRRSADHALRNAEQNLTDYAGRDVGAASSSLLLLAVAFVCLVLGGALNTALAASNDQLRLADPQVLLELSASDTPGLPRDLTPQERAFWRLPDLTGAPRLAPPASQLLTAAEYERNQAIVMRWGSFNSVLTAMIVPITTGDSLARVLLVVASPTQQADAANFLDAAGADLERVDFLIAPSNSVWIRDYGPRFASADNDRVIIDHEYNRPRPLDNRIPVVIANYLDEALFDMPLNHGGGNFHLFANGEAFMTDLIVDENPGLNEQDVIDLYADFHGLDLTMLPALPSAFDSTQHLDMWFLPVDDRTVIIGDYRSPPPGINPSGLTSTVVSVTELTVQLMEARGYTVLRTPGWRAQTGGHHTYTNAVIVNDLVLICRFNAFPTQNAQAQAVFEQAFPDKAIIPVDCGEIINFSGALHCIVKHIPAATFRLELDQRQATACVPNSGSTKLSFELSSTAINGFDGTISLLSTGEPAGVSSQFTPSGLGAPGVASWILSIDAAAVAGQSEISLIGDDGVGPGLTLGFSLSLEAEPSGAELLAPPDMAEAVDLAPDLEWVAVTGALDYRIQLAGDPDFSWVLIDQRVSGTVLSVEEPLISGRTFFWRVSAANDCGEGDWGPTRSFRTRLLTEPESRLFRDRFQPNPDT